MGPLDIPAHAEAWKNHTDVLPLTQGDHGCLDATPSAASLHRGKAQPSQLRLLRLE